MSWSSAPDWRTASRQSRSRRSQVQAAPRRIPGAMPSRSALDHGEQTRSSLRGSTGVALLAARIPPTAAGPANGPRHGKALLGLYLLGVGAIVQAHHHIGAVGYLQGNAFLGREQKLALGPFRQETQPAIAQAAEFAVLADQRIGLEAAGVGDNRSAASRSSGASRPGPRSWRSPAFASDGRRSSPRPGSRRRASRSAASTARTTPSVASGRKAGRAGRREQATGRVVIRVKSRSPHARVWSASGPALRRPAITTTYSPLRSALPYLSQRRKAIRAHRLEQLGQVIGQGGLTVSVDSRGRPPGRRAADRALVEERVWGPAASTARKARRAPDFRGGKPRKVKLCTGRRKGQGP